MSDDLKPCPFCGGGITTIEGGGQIWRGVNGYSDPQFYHLRHFGKLSETDDFPRCFVEFRCRTEAEAIAAWNTRTPDPRIKALTAELTLAEQRGYANAMEAERKLHEDHIEALTAEREFFEEEWVSAVDKLNKAVEALVSLVKQASTTSSRGAVTGPHWTHLTVAILKARTTLAEIEGEQT
jgi:hypothetical protein